jgi:hypothetical protein
VNVSAAAVKDTLFSRLSLRQVHVSFEQLKNTYVQMLKSSM